MLFTLYLKVRRSSGHPGAKRLPAMRQRGWKFLVAVLTVRLCCWDAPISAQSLKVPFAALSPNYAPLWIADQAGLFKKYGLDVQLIYISAGSVIVPAILSGQVDIANMSSAPALTAWARGAELSAVGVTSNRLLHVIMTRSSIKRPEDLKNKKIGGDRFGSLSDLILREALRYYKLVPDRDVAVIQTGGLPERLGALKVGAVDGAIVTGDTALEAEKLGFHKLIDLSQLPIRYPSSTIIVSKSFLAAKRDTVKRFLRGWIEGIKIAKTDKEYTISVMQKFLKTSDRSVLDKIFEIYKTVHERVPTPDPKLMAVALKQLAATIPQTNQLKVEDFTDQSLIAELESEGFIAKVYDGR
ncbi:MAG TPA: ABC transporter substrate-binding protein [Verrucomicrobiae bacterium]|nr:ABC transporter substrate-binding protein [Verrucomicrobiae bacterium]